MYQNEYNVRELLELALRVPEVGAVNFNILYYILKVIIQKQGIAEVKPDFSLQTPFATSSNAKKIRASLRRSHSAESLTTSEALKRTESEEDFSQKSPKIAEKQSEKFQKILFSKRMNGVEEEISELHVILAQIAEKMSNTDRVIGLQETKFMKQIRDLHGSLESKEDDYSSLAQKFEEMASKVSVLSEMAAKSKEAKGRKDEVESEIKMLEDALSDETNLENARLDKTNSENVLLNETSSEDILDETNLEDDTLDNTNLNEVVLAEASVEDIELDETNIEVAPLVETSFEELELETYKSKMVKMKSDEAKSDQTTLSIIDQELLDKIETVNKKIESMKENISKKDVAKIDLELLNVSAEVNKLMEKCATLDKIFSSELKIMKEKYLVLEQTFSVQKEDLEALKLHWDEMVYSFEGIKENLQSIEKEMAVLTEFPGVKNRVELLEDYMYSGSESEGKSSKRRSLMTGVEKRTGSISTSERKDIVVFKPTVKRAEKAKAQKIEDVVETGAAQRDFHVGGKFLAVSRNIALIQDMDRKQHAQKFKMDDLDEDFEDEDDYLYEEPVYKPLKKLVTEDFGVLEAPSHAEVKIIEQQPDAKGSTFTSPDALQEFSHQLKGQVVVFVKKRLHDLELELQQIEGNLTSTAKKVDFLEKMSRDLNEKVAFMDSNFSQRAGDLATLKELVGNHQGSIVNIVHHLERKAEAYIVNQKVSRKELTVIEDRVLKLCRATSSEISKLEETMADSLKKFTFELDKKLFTEEFEVRFEFLLHKLKMLGNKLKDASITTPILDFEEIRPVQIKKYAVCSKEGYVTKMRPARRRIGTCNTSESIIPILTQHHTGLETSPKTAAQIEKELELASYRDSKRFVEGAYTKLKVGRK